MTIEINLSELGKVQYLTEVLPEIPTNTILYKKLTGLGATYGEITAKRNSIIIEPNVPVILVSAMTLSIKMIICSEYMKVYILTIL